MIIAKIENYTESSTRSHNHFYHRCERRPLPAALTSSSEALLYPIVISQIRAFSDLKTIEPGMIHPPTRSTAAAHAQVQLAIEKNPFMTYVALRERQETLCIFLNRGVDIGRY